MSDIADAAKKAQDNPKWFFNHILKFPALEWQLEAIHAVFDLRRDNPLYNTKKKPRLTIRSCHGTGKTQFLAMLMHIWNFTTYGKIACTAPKQQQLTKRLLPRYRSAMRDAIGLYKGFTNVLGKEVIFGGDRDWGASLETASDPESLAGYHDKPQLFLIDEASGKKLDPMYPVIEGALTTEGSCVAEIGNPTRVEGEFYRHHMETRCRDMYYRMHIKPNDAPELISQRWLDDMAVKYGKTSPIYLIRCLGEFAAYDDYVLIQLDDYDEALDSDHEPDGSHPALRISVDVADGGADCTVITAGLHYDTYSDIIMQRGYYFNASESPIEAARAAIRMFEGFEGRKDIDDFVIDANGVGSGTAGYLMDQGYRVVRHVGGEASDLPDRFRNRRVQNFITLYEYFRDGKIRINSEGIDDEEELRGHIFSIKRRVQNEKVDDLEPKEAIKRLGLPSPDRADALAMQFIDKAYSSISIDPQIYGAVGQIKSTDYG